MARIFITGSSTGLGLMTAALLAEKGHAVVLHARNEERAKAAMAVLPAAHAVVEGDISTIRATMRLAEKANRHGPYDAVIHNVAVGYREPQRIETGDGLPHVFAVNTLAPFILTALIERPKRLVYLSSGLHRNASADLDDIFWEKRRWDGTEAYSESKLHDVLLAFAFARYWPDTLSNALEPGWVPTRMGGPAATDDLDQAHRTQAWLAVSDDPAAVVTGSYFYHMQPREVHAEVRNIQRQDRLIAICERLSGQKLDI
jgi:NAD(P)-dependent dehydrogenase (short-subunit alcohol dehydrogenase family)